MFHPDIKHQDECLKIDVFFQFSRYSIKKSNAFMSGGPVAEVIMNGHLRRFGNSFPRHLYQEKPNLRLRIERHMSKNTGWSTKLCN